MVLLGSLAADAAVVPGDSIPIIYSNDGDIEAIGSVPSDAMPMVWSPSDDILAYAVAGASLATGGASSIHLLDPASGDRVVADLSRTRVGGAIGMTADALRLAGAMVVIATLEAYPALLQ